MAMFSYRAPTELMHVDGGWVMCRAPNADVALTKLRKKTTVELNQLQVFAGLRWNFADRIAPAVGGTWVNPTVR